MTVEANKEVIRKLTEEVRNKGNLALIPELISPEFIFSGSGREIRGPEGFKESTLMWRNAFPDLHRTTIDIVAEGDLVATRERFHGTFKRGMPIPPLEVPTGELIDYVLAHFYRFKDGKVAESVVVANNLGVKGFLPPDSTFRR